MGRYLLSALLTATALVGCASPASPGIVNVGPDTYLLRPVANPENMSVNGVKSKMLRQAEEFCQSDGRRMQQIVSMARENAIGIYTAPEVQFRCMLPRDGEGIADVNKARGKLEIR